MNILFLVRYIILRLQHFVRVGRLFLILVSKKRTSYLQHAVYHAWMLREEDYRLQFHIVRLLIPLLEVRQSTFLTQMMKMTVE